MQSCSSIVFSALQCSNSSTVDAVHVLDYLLCTTSILLCVMLYVMYLFVLFVLQADMYKKDFESERYDRTRLADQMNKSQVQQVHVCESYYVMKL